MTLKISKTRSIMSQDKRHWTDSVYGRISPELKKSLKYLLPVSLLHSTIADNEQDRKMLFKFIKLEFHGFCHAPGHRHIWKALTELVHGPPHISNLFINFISIQLLKRS